MMKKVVFICVLLGMLESCNQTTSVSKATPPTPSASIEEQATPEPMASPTEQPAVNEPVPPGRCDKNGFLTTSQPIDIQTIENTSGFTRYKDEKGYDAYNHLCHNPLTDTLLITNGTEVLEFNPRTRNITKIIDTQLTGFSHDQKQGFQFQKLGKCSVNTSGLIYLSEGTHVYSIETSNKRITTLQYLDIESKGVTDQFIGPVNFSEANNDRIFIREANGIYRTNNKDLELVLRVIRGVEPWGQGLFPAQVNPVTKLPVDIRLTDIGAIASDDKDNVYFTSSHQHGFFKLTPSGTLYMIDPKGITQLDSGYRNTKFLGSTFNLIYHPTYRVFFRESGTVVTRDGCIGKVLPNPNLTYQNVAITNDGSLYAFNSQIFKVLQLKIPPGLPEAAQWEPPQAWKDATGLD